MWLYFWEGIVLVEALLVTVLGKIRFWAMSLPLSLCFPLSCFPKSAGLLMIHFLGLGASFEVWKQLGWSGLIQLSRVYVSLGKGCWRFIHWTVEYRKVCRVWGCWKCLVKKKWVCADMYYFHTTCAAIDEALRPFLGWFTLRLDFVRHGQYWNHWTEWKLFQKWWTWQTRTFPFTKIRTRLVNETVALLYSACLYVLLNMAQIWPCLCVALPPLPPPS